MARPKQPKTKSPAKPTSPSKPAGTRGQMGIGDFMREQFEERRGRGGAGNGSASRGDRGAGGGGRGGVGRGGSSGSRGGGPIGKTRGADADDAADAANIAAATAGSPALPAKKPPKPNPKPAQGPDGATRDSVAKEGSELGGGYDEHGSVGGGLISRALARVGQVLRGKRDSSGFAGANAGGGSQSPAGRAAANAGKNGTNGKRGKAGGADGRSNGKSGANGRSRKGRSPDALGMVAGRGGETHQLATDEVLTTNQGTPVSDDQNSLKIGVRGPTLIEDFHFREKITHFDHERIPERIVHARGSAAHGYFQPYRSFADLTRAQFLQDPAERTPVFARFSTVVGGAGSVDLPRDVRGFAVKFYTQEGVFDLVGNNIPVFFIQDALKFPDLVHSVKMEPDRGFPQNATAHDTFWDFVSLMPESMHMLMWAMSDRTIPRSYRMMEGFGVHTFKLVNADGEVTFVKWHWRPLVGSQSVVWDEAVKINGADQDFHRRDLFMAIQAGAFPEYELSVQAFTADDVADFPFDVLDSTKIIPEELVPLTPVGKMVLDRWPDNFFAETEQAAFHPGHVVPGIDFSDDPLLHGRLFSYTDTQLKRLGGPNFHEIPINRPRCPMRNFQRDGHMRQEINRGRVNYEPNSLAPGFPRQSPDGFVTHAEVAVPGDPGALTKIRARSETFADHYSQARQFFHSMTEPEQRHIVNAFTFELSKVDTLAVRTRMLGHLDIIDPELGARVADALGMTGQADPLVPAREPIDLEPSPALSILAKHQPTLQGRKVGVMIGDGFDRSLVEKLRAAVLAEGAMFELVAPKIGGALAGDGTQVPADHMILGGPSVLFDAVVVAPGAGAIPTLLVDAAAKQWVADAFAHCKVIGVVGAAQPLLDAAGVKPDAGIIAITSGSIDAFIETAKEGRIWAREVMTLGPDKKSATSAVASRQTPATGKAKTVKPPAKPAKPAAKSARR